MVIGYDASRAVRPRPTGTEVYAAEVLRALGALDGGEEYLLYVNARSAPRFGPVPASARWRPLWLPRAWTRIALDREMRRRPPDLLFVPSHVLPPTLPRRSVVTLHGLEHLAVPDAYTAAERRRLDRFAARDLARASAVVAPSETTKADAVVRLGLDAERIEVIPHGVRAGFEPPAGAQLAEVLRRHRLERDGYLLLVGAGAPRKDPLTAVLALAQARRDPAAAGLRLAVTGAGAATARRVAAEAARAGAGDAVAWLGYVPDADLPSLMAGALAFLFPSRYEGFGLPAIEAMACGAACVLSDAGALSEVSQVAAMLVPPGDAAAWAEAIVRVASGPELRASLRERGLRRAARFSWEASARAHLALWRRLSQGG